MLLSSHTRRTGIVLASTWVCSVDPRNEKRRHEAEEEEETGPTFARDDRKSDAIRQKGVKLRYTEQESCVSVNIVPSERMVSSSSIDFLPVSSIGL